MKTINLCKLLCIGIWLSTNVNFAQDQAAVYSKINQDLISKESPMKTYVIEREIPNAGNLTPEQLQGIARTSNKVLSEMGSGIEWVQSYVTENKVYCVYRSENKEAIMAHAKKGGFPADKISELSTIIDPSTARD